MNGILDSTNVSLKTHIDLLSDLQGNILKFHGRTHAFHIFLQFDRELAEAARDWISRFNVTSSATQLGDAHIRKSNPTHDGGAFFNFSLAASGYEELGIPEALIPSERAFRDGLQNRVSETADDLEKWEPDFRQRIDALIIVADSNISKATLEKDRILNEVSGFAKIVHVQKGKVLRNASGIGIEHFGYADGVSQPSFLAHNDSPASQWDDNGALLKTLLVPEANESDTETFGSYFVFRKLDQNVRKFKEMEDRLSKQFNKVSDEEYGILNRKGKSNRELAGAMIVGRFEDGTAVTNHSDEFGITGEAQLENDFDYRDDLKGLKCPFHAHIRITNPRRDVSNEFAKSVRLTRRGIPYNDIGRDEHNLEEDQPDGGVGLLFMCYQSSIEGQFEFIQRDWANKGDIGGKLVGQDAIIGQGPNGFIKSLPNQWNTDTGRENIPTDFRDFVTMKGGEYFFTPSIGFLRGLV
ncbi:Dyp-type peroxidase [Dyadobacter sp. LJ53]|uniref:Dyp-type peroxidase n=1 Tax=Dyadobacter chenwenxiniae TaxID=2906456 RepID=UPI001F1E625C|nr:Dyp-type peroxidase [Dyadobacter chenwenxiniae]MCF0051628.1 Dyp-type peroxidase [Dyadobacter chenwenxiniae]